MINGKELNKAWKTMLENGFSCNSEDFKWAIEIAMESGMAKNATDAGRVIGDAIRQSRQYVMPDVQPTSIICQKLCEHFIREMYSCGVAVDFADITTQFALDEPSKYAVTEYIAEKMSEEPDFSIRDVLSDASVYLLDHSYGFSLEQAEDQARHVLDCQSSARPGM